MGRRCEDLAERLLPDNLQELQDSFSGAAGLPVLFVHPGGRPITACEDLSLFCRWFTRSVVLSRPCVECGRAGQVAELATADAGALRFRSLLHLCPLGLVDIAVPILAAGESLAYLVSVQSRLEAASPSLEAARASSPEETEECLTFASRLQGRSHPEMEAAAAGLSVVASLTGAVAASRRRNLRLAERIREQGRQIQEQTTADAVTGVANRRHFHAALEAEIERARRYKRTVSVAVLDIEGFRRINEGFGHDTGDAVLRAVGNCIAATVRQTDLAGRVGGDEFALLFPETSRSEAMLALARVAAQINELNASGELPVEVRLAMGVVDRTHESDDLLEAAFQAARQVRGLPSHIG